MKKYTFKHVAEYITLRAVAGFAGWLPYRAALGLGWCIAWIGFFLFRFRVPEAKKRIREVFGDRFTDREVSRIAWLSWRNLCFNGIDILRIPCMSEAWVRKVLDSESVMRIWNAQKEERGLIFALPHMGSWDMAGTAGRILDIPVFFLTHQQKNPLTNGHLERMRALAGIETLERDAPVLKKIIRKLQEKKVLAITPDVRSKTKVISVNFLGKPANLPGGIGLFARQADVPICPVIARRKGWTKHTWQPHKLIWSDPKLDKKVDWARMTQQVMDIFDQAVRETPEQFFWYNKRWVLEPFLG